MKWWHWLLLAAGVGTLILKKKAPSSNLRTGGRNLTDKEQARLRSLRPDFRAKIVELMTNVAARGVNLFIVSGARNAAQQAEKVAKGVSATSRSWHLAGLAVDFAVIVAQGKLDYGDGPDKGKLAVLHEEAAKLGLETFGFRELKTGSGKTFTDPGHVQWKDPRGWEVAAAEFQKTTTGVV